MQAIDRIDRGSGGRLLVGAGEVTLYQAAVTVMMRLLFLLAAEQRGLLLLETELHDQRCAVTRLRDQLEEIATQQGEEVLERRHDAWCRLLATFRAVHGGAQHEDLWVPAYGGSLFDPDRFPFLEGRGAGTSWRDAGGAAPAPLAIEDRTVLQLLRSMQLLEAREGGGRAEARRPSSRAIEVEQIGHVYEALLDHTAKRATGTHYTPRSLTEPIVQHTLDPLVYEGPAEGWAREAWRLRTPREILSLRVCDMAVGSGAFLVQACRYLGERLVEAWEEAEKAVGGRLVLTPAGELSKGEPTERPAAIEAEERLTLGRRYVADRCLYGVDKDPMAVEMAKLSLWLVTLHADRPFTFLDHALRSGDSLLGLTRRDQIASFHLVPARGKALQANLFDVIPALRLILQSRAATEDLRLVADLVVAAALATAAKGDRALDEKLAELSPFVAELLRQGTAVEARETTRRDLRRRARALLDEGREPRHPERTPFHWVIEFPEVFEAGGFDAFVGNPPFQGGMKLSTVHGTEYREYLVRHVAAGVKGHADLCAYFFLRSQEMLRERGGFGLVATNTIAQGATREVGLDQLLRKGMSIPRAVRSRPWPGHAALEVAHVWAHNGVWRGQVVLDDRTVSAITPSLAARGAIDGNPRRLKANAGSSFVGSYVLGAGFLLDPDEAAALVAKDGDCAAVLFPYLTGEDLNSRVDQSPSRCVIQFDERDEGEARAYADVWRIAEERIKPERLTKDARKYPRMVGEWWKHWNNRRELRAAIRELPRVLVRARVSSTHGFVFVPSTLIGSEQVVFFAFEAARFLCLLQSTFHEAWVVAHASTLGAGTRYTPSDCFETFPFPACAASLDPIGERYHEHRRQIMLATRLGLTRTYNRFHDPADTSHDLGTLRDLHVEMDLAVAAAYGFTDLRLDHGFHDTRQGLRFTVGEPARREILDLLLELNHARHAEEVAAGLHDKDAPRKTRASKATATAAPPPQPPIRGSVA